MSHYIEAHCITHGDWDMDSDFPSSCPECEKERDAKLARYDEMERRVKELEDWKVNAECDTAFWKERAEAGTQTPAPTPPAQEPEVQMCETCGRGLHVDTVFGGLFCDGQHEGVTPLERAVRQLYTKIAGTDSTGDPVYHQVDATLVVADIADHVTDLHTQFDTLAQRVRELEHLQKTCGEVQPIDLTQSGTASSDPVDVDPFWLAQWRTIPDGAFGRREVAVSYLRQSVAFADRLKQRVREVEAERDEIIAALGVTRDDETDTSWWLPAEPAPVECPTLADAVRADQRLAENDIAEIRAQLTAATERATIVEAAAREALGYMIGEVVGCNGRKCRESNCEDCCEEEGVRAYVQNANNASHALRAALAAAAPGPVKESLTADAAAPSGETTR